MASESRMLRMIEKEAREILAAVPDNPATRHLREMAANDLQLVRASLETLRTTKKAKVQ